tara:strand:+ start:1240 stop:1446 length:207 start_codon:yes stop_codon:yes gene_type:complete
MRMKNKDVQHKELHQFWRKFETSEEEQRLKVLDARIARRKLILNDDLVERRKIMMRAIRRMRRAAGKS